MIVTGIIICAVAMVLAMVNMGAMFVRREGYGDPKPHVVAHFGLAAAAVIGVVLIAIGVVHALGAA